VVNFATRIVNYISPFGPKVTLIRKLFNGTEEIEQLPAVIAVILLMEDPENGRTYQSARIDWGDVLDEYPPTPNYTPIEMIRAKRGQHAG
jgi:hypothetical protein